MSTLSTKLSTFFRRPTPTAPTLADLKPTLVGQPIPGLVAPSLTFTSVNHDAELQWIEQTLAATPEMLDEGTADVLDAELIERHLSRVHLLTVEAQDQAKAISAYQRDLDQVEGELRPYVLAARQEYARLTASAQAWDDVLAGTTDEFVPPAVTDGVESLPTPKVGLRHPLRGMPVFDASAEAPFGATPVGEVPFGVAAQEAATGGPSGAAAGPVTRSPLAPTPLPIPMPKIARGTRAEQREAGSFSSAPTEPTPAAATPDASKAGVTPISEVTPRPEDPETLRRTS